MKIDFKQFLVDEFIKLNPQVLDDDMIDDFDIWLADELSLDELIRYGQEYAELVKTKAFIEYKELFN